MTVLKNFKKKGIIYSTGWRKFKLLCLKYIVDNEHPRKSRILLPVIATYATGREYTIEPRKK